VLGELFRVIAAHPSAEDEATSADLDMEVADQSADPVADQSVERRVWVATIHGADHVGIGPIHGSSSRCESKGEHDESTVHAWATAPRGMWLGAE
jgi:hypothetical protein